MLSPMDASPAPPLRSRILIALAAVAWSLVLATLAHRLEGGVPRDIDQLWFAARAALEHRNPFALIGPGREYNWAWQLYYPGTSIAAALPLTPFPSLVARFLFIAVGVGALVFALTRDSWWRLWALVSPCFLLAVQYAQWSPLLTAALFFPALTLLVSAKPNIGLAVLVTSTSRDTIIWAVAGTVVLLVVSFVLVPSWVPSWREALVTATHVRGLLFRPSGLVLLLALARWRRPEARLLVVLAAVPQTPYLYDALPLLAFVPAKRIEAIALTALSWVAVIVQTPYGPWAGFPERAATFGTLTITLLYLPALFLILLRPNAGVAPAWLERRLAALPVPRWFVGSDAARAKMLE
jgi:hypothetical protein